LLRNEGIAGRGANHLSSALIAVLTCIVHEHSEIHNIILWSDSCIPQNRNSIMSTALLDFMKKHPNIIITEQKFCEPGHSCIQEVDNVHSQNEKRLRILEVFSPVSLIRALRNTNKRSPFTIIELTSEDFQDYQHAAKQLNFHSLPVPYSKVRHIMSRKSSAGSNSSKSENNSTDTELTLNKRGLIQLQYLMFVQHVRSCGPACSVMMARNSTVSSVIWSKLR